MTMQIQTMSAEHADFTEPREEARLLEHAYDGIREYDNPLPGWWRVTFAATIVFAFLYLAYYDIAHWGTTPDAKYQSALAGWQAIYKGTSDSGGPNVTEASISAGAQNGDVIAQGADIFKTRCVGCHADEGRGQIGPNLTDLYQIHGTTRLDIYDTVRGGAPGTAMIAWGEVMKPGDIIAVATYVSSLRGKNVAGGKAPQGKPVPALAP
jgi:cytochrome c oxidase cbb3-type subunit 3